MTKLREGEWGAYTQRYAREDVQIAPGSITSVFVSALRYPGEDYKPPRVEFVGTIMVRDLPKVLDALSIAIDAYEARWGKIKT